MFKLILASRNEGKLREIRELLEKNPIEILSVKDYPNCPDSKEPFDTYLENARDKARLVAEHCGGWALADDSGLEVEALKGKPGIMSARYAGADVSYQENYQKILSELKGVPEDRRGARFRCCMVLRHPDGQEEVTEGVLEGRITLSPMGDQGFGYDPIFWVPEAGKTLAQLSLDEKNRISHRHRALMKMIPRLQALIDKMKKNK